MKQSLAPFIFPQTLVLLGIALQFTACGEFRGDFPGLKDIPTNEDPAEWNPGSAGTQGRGGDTLTTPTAQRLSGKWRGLNRDSDHLLTLDMRARTLNLETFVFVENSTVLTSSEPAGSVRCRVRMKGERIKGGALSASQTRLHPGYTHYFDFVWTRTDLAADGRNHHSCASKFDHEAGRPESAEPRPNRMIFRLSGSRLESVDHGSYEKIPN